MRPTSSFLPIRDVTPLLALLAASVLAACETTSAASPAPAAAPPPTVAAPAAAPTADDAKSFLGKVNQELKAKTVRSATADWIRNTYITDDTERNSAAVNEELLGYISSTVKDSVKFRDLKLDPDSERMLYLLRISTATPAPSDAARRAELTQLTAKLEGMYGKGKYCRQGESGEKCRDLEVLSTVMAKSHDYNELLDAWKGWHSISRDMRPLYSRLAVLSNEGAREVGYADLGDLWKAGYDMPSADFEKETDRLWQQVKPLYDDLHCYVRARLAKTYGADHVPAKGPIPAHLLGNMWAQEWTNIYPLVEPYPGQASLDVTAVLEKAKPAWDPIRMVKLGESFFTSLGLDPLPASFWERSQFVKPRDREVVCHASAWDVQYDNDLRIKMCIKPTEEDLVTIHHELGHDYYFHYYYKLPVLFQGGANDGFHEAIGDALTLSITPEYLQKVGILGTPQKNPKNLINLQLKNALEKVAFLPFGKLIDQWRWDVFSGKTTPEHYNEAWWALRRKYQGVDAPIARSEADFDPGAKYHVPASVPYTRYFLARILQFQFHRALCQAAGIKGPLHECSIYGNKVAGDRLRAMLAMGASKPWPDALEALTGQRQMDATAMLEYFQPLQVWLKEQNKGQSCGW